MTRHARRATSSGQKPPRFSKSTLGAIEEASLVGIRSGDEHRYTGIWVVVVGQRVFVRSWNDKPTGWHKAFAAEPSGSLRVGDREIPVVAKPVRGAATLAAVDAAYRRKYHTPASLKWVRGFRLARRRATTTELRPFTLPETGNPSTR